MDACSSLPWLHGLSYDQVCKATMKLKEDINPVMANGGAKATADQCNIIIIVRSSPAAV